MSDTRDPLLRRITPFEGQINDDGEQVGSGQDERGHEIPDPVPMAVPVGMHQGASLADTVRRMVQHQLFAQAAAMEGFDTEEEADDFDVPDEPPDPLTAYEKHFIQAEDDDPTQAATPPAERKTPTAEAPKAEAAVQAEKDGGTPPKAQ